MRQATSAPSTQAPGHGRPGRPGRPGRMADGAQPDMAERPETRTAAGNWRSPAWPWRRLMLPFTLITMGLALVGALEITGVRAYLPGSAAAKAAGLIAACGAVVIWTWYALANARFLDRHRSVSPAR